MRLDEILQFIPDTDASHWHVITDYPIFHHSFEFSSSGSGQASITGVESHTRRAVLRSDIDVALEWGMRRMRDEKEFYPWNEPQRFADPNVHTFWVDLFYRDAVVEREMLVSVDGSRATLPVAHSRRIDGKSFGEPATSGSYEHYTTRAEYDLARLIDDLDGGRDFDGYFARSKFKIE